MENFKNSFAKIKTETSELKEEIRLERFKKKIMPEVQKVYAGHDARKADLERRAGRVEGILAAELAVKEPETETAQLTTLLKRQEIRKGFETIPAKDRRAFYLAKIEAGNRDFYDRI